MADRFPLILNTSASQIQEIASGDQLDLTGNNIANAGIVTATAFHGDGSNLSGLSVGGATGIDFNDNVKARFGNTNDLVIFYENGGADRGKIGTVNNRPLDLLTNNTQRIVIENNGHVRPAINNSYDLGTAGDRWRNVYGVDGNFSGNLTVGGVLTYEDVTNIDSVGIITARSDVKVGSGVTITPAGTGFYAGTVTASDFVKRDGSGLVGSDAQSNTLVGTNAGANFSGTSASSNTLVGRNAGGSITTGVQNTVIGSYALSQNQTGDENIAIGKGAFEKFTASFGVAIGLNAATNVSRGMPGIIMGRNACYTATTLGASVVIGMQAASAATNVSNCVIIGDYAKSSGNLGSNNIIIGQQADCSSASAANEITLGNSNINHFRIPGIGVSFSEGGAVFSGIVTATNFAKADGTSLGGVASDSQENTLAGTNAGDAIQQYGERNCFFGFDAGTDLTTGSDNVFIGHRAGEDVTTANNNTIVGSLSGERLTTQYNNTFVGQGAGMEATSSNNVYIGYYSGKNHGSGSGMCIGIGNQCNYYNGSRIANIAIGHQALYGNFSHQKEFNLAIGHEALYTSRNDFNIGIGASVGGGNGDPAITGTRNILMGTYAGQNLTSGSDNTIIGDRAGDLIDAGSNCIIIGHDADASSNGVLNEITLGDTNISKFRIPGIQFEINQEKVTTQGLDTNGMLKEHTQIVSGKLSDNVNINTSVGNVYHFTTQETTTSTPNIRFDGVAGSFNSNVDIGDTVSVTIITTAAAAAYSANLNIDGSSVTVNWVGGSAPSAGGSSGVDIYTYNIIKTANNTFTVIGNLTKTS